MQTVLQGIPGTDCFIDDIVIWGTTPEEHDVRLREVLLRCQQNGLSLNPSKCVFHSPSVKYFGHILTSDGVRADEDKARAVADFPTPQSKEDLQRFLGMIAYLAKFLPRHSQTSAPLRELLKQEVAWCWTPAQEDAFRQLRAMASTAPVLAYYSLEADTIVSADASSFGIGSSSTDTARRQTSASFIRITRLDDGRTTVLTDRKRGLSNGMGLREILSVIFSDETSKFWLKLTTNLCKRS